MGNNIKYEELANKHLGVQVPESLYTQVEALANELTRARPPGSHKVSKSDIVRQALFFYLQYKDETGGNKS